MDFVEPIRGVECAFELVERTQLIMSPYQRDLAQTLVNKLIVSVDQGFIVPLLVVRAGEKFAVIDGQHRLAAADKLMGKDPFFVPCIVLPERFMNRPLYYNIEKSDNILDQATQVYNLYNTFLKEAPETIERELAPACGFTSYLISIAFAYREFDISSPSLVEPPCKKLDAKSFLSDPLDTAIVVRRNRAMLIRDLENTINAAAAEYDVKDFQLKVTMVSQASQKLWGARVRHVDESFEDGMAALIQTIDSNDWGWMRGR